MSGTRTIAERARTRDLTAASLHDSAANIPNASTSTGLVSCMRPPPEQGTKNRHHSSNRAGLGNRTTVFGDLFAHDSPSFGFTATSHKSVPRRGPGKSSPAVRRSNSTRLPPVLHLRRGVVSGMSLKEAPRMLHDLVDML